MFEKRAFIKIEVIEVSIHAYIPLNMCNRATNSKSRVMFLKIQAIAIKNYFCNKLTEYSLNIMIAIGK